MQLYLPNLKAKQFESAEVQERKAKPWDAQVMMDESRI